MSNPYSMRAVVRATGLSEHTLRAWERRYGAVTPQRSDGGTRLYSADDLERLTLLKRATDSGHRIGSIAHHSRAELVDLVDDPKSDAEKDASAAARDRALDAIVRFDAAAAERALADSFAALGPTRFGLEVALPLLREVGDRWHAGELGEANEHLATTLVRNLLGVAIRSQPRAPDAFTLLTTTLPGEAHEPALLVAALLAIDAGHRAIHLGVDLPVEETARAAREAGADAVLLAFTSQQAANAGALRELASALPTSTEIWIGGPACPSPDDAMNAQHFSDLEALLRHLESVHPN